MKIATLICRILLGLMFVVFGLNHFLHFIPMGPPPPAGTPAANFMGSMMATGWMRIVAAFEVAGGLLVLIGGTAPIGLVLLGPVIFNALLFHLLMAGGHEIAAAAVAALLEIVCLVGYRTYFAPIFTASARPVA